jgi:AICAR transformylase/IMP cyclohydrolase PurH
MRYCWIVAKHTQSNAVVIATAIRLSGSALADSRASPQRKSHVKKGKPALYDHPKILALEFQPALDRIEKINVVEQFLESTGLNSTGNHCFALKSCDALHL